MSAARRGGGIGRWLKRLSLLAALLLLLLAGGFAWFLLRAAAEPEAAPLRRTDGIAVLTGGADRVQTGLRLLEEEMAAQLLVSGTHQSVTLAELARAANMDVAPLAPLATRITLGRAAATTRGNAQEVAEWARALGLRSLRVVTAGYHMPRALLELRRALPEAELLPHPVQPAALRGSDAVTRGRTWRLLLGEYAKFLGAGLGLSRFLTVREGRAEVP
jgi:uncharacterized SAM-binding protein YcdF (DUF218 family)